jgi:hypothetical protein
MWGLHLKKRGRRWHYCRAVPDRFRDVDNRRLISFSLRTCDFTPETRACVQIDRFSSSDQTRFRGFFLPAIAHLKISNIDGGHLAGTPSRRQSGDTGRIHGMSAWTGLSHAFAVLFRHFQYMDQSKSIQRPCDN